MKLNFQTKFQIQVLLTDTGEYAIRYPMDTNINIEDELIREINYNDPHAVIDATDWTSISRQQHQEKFDTILTEDSDMFHKFFNKH